jgi:membrane protein YdbS with pleckstrin-like domain
MYERLKATLLSLLKVPPEPHDPMGDVHSLRVFRAAPGYLQYITVGWIISQVAVFTAAVLLVAPIGVALAAASGLLAIGLIALIVLTAVLVLCEVFVTYFSLRLSYEMRWYKVTDRSLRIRDGVWNVNEMTLTFANIQNISITQGPLERLFGISDVRVQTAGGGGGSSSGPHGKSDGSGSNLHVAVFRGVDNPEEIRNLMLDRLRSVRSTGLGDPDDSHVPVPSVDTLSLLAALRDEARALRKAMRLTS